MFQLVQAQEGPCPRVIRDGGVICCFNGNEGSLKCVCVCGGGDVTVILHCMMFGRLECCHYLLPRLSLVASLGDGWYNERITVC